MKRKTGLITAASVLSIAAIGGYTWYANHQTLNSTKNTPITLTTQQKGHNNDHAAKKLELNATRSSKPLSSKNAVIHKGNLQPNVYYTNRVVIVTFHDMSSKLLSPWDMSAQLFNEDLSAIQANYFNVISNRRFIGWLNHQNSIPDNAVLLTFDDGYRSMYTHALPILLKHHMTGTFFDIVFRQDTNAPGFLSWGELEAMKQEGMTIACHTYNSHYEVPVNGKETPVFDTPIVVDGKKETWNHYFKRDFLDFKKAKYELETHLGVPVTEFAWPYGWGTHAATLAAEEAGYRYLFTTASGDVTPRTDPLAIPRIDIGKPNITPSEAIQDILKAAVGEPSRNVPNTLHRV